MIRGRSLGPKRGRKSRRQLLKSVLDYELLWTAVAVALIVLFIAPQLPLPVRDYQPGDIAVADVSAPVDFQVVDPESTRRRQDEAETRAGDLYDHDRRVIADAFATINRLFSWGRRQDADGAGRWDRLPQERRSQLEEAAAAAAGRALPEGLVGTLWDEGFTVGTELVLARSLKGVLEEHLVGTLVTPPGAGTVVFVRDIETQEQRRLDGSERLIDPNAARQLLRTSLGTALELPQATEEALGNFAATLLRPNLTFNSNETLERRQRARQRVEPVFYEVKRGRRIVRAGDEVDAQTILELHGMRQALGPGRSLLSIGGTALLVGLAVVSLWRYTVHYRRRFRYQRVRWLYLLTLTVLVGMVVLIRLSLFLGEAVGSSMTREPFSVVAAYRFAVPLAAGAMLVLLLVDTQVAWAFAGVFALVVGAVTQDLTLTLYALVGSFVGVYGMSQYKQRTALVRTGLLVGSVNVVAVLGLALLAQPPAPWTIISFQALCALLGGVLVSMVVTFALPPLETLFQSMTDVKLLELSNMNLPLLKKLAVTAPGTYHHSVVMGTLAEQAAEAIGVNPLFARVAAYYHDIGKIRQPHYFVENQKDGHNPHDRLSPHMSALVLVNHIREGIAYAEEHGLPQPLIDMIPQHHGTRLMLYFYEKARQQADPDVDEIDEEEFRYPGPKPQSKEAAILMLADSVEAVSRAMGDPSPTRLRSVIRKVVRDVLEDDQLDECGITMADLSSVQDAFFNVLAAMHHHRIEYPTSGELEGEEVAVGFKDEDHDPQLPGQTYH